MKGLIALKAQVAMTTIKVNKDEELNRRGRGHIVDMTTADPSRGSCDGCHVTMFDHGRP